MRCSASFHSAHGDAAVPVVKIMKTINIIAVRNLIAARNLIGVMFFALVLVHSISVQSISAQNTPVQELDDIITDRPDQTESAVTVPKGLIQIEIGGTYEKERIQSPKLIILPKLIKTISAPSILVRWGILKDLELRFASEYITENTRNDVTTISTLDEDASGIAPITLGTKIQLFTEKGSRPDAAFLFHLNIPFKKNDPFQPEYIGADFRVAIAHSLSERFSLSYNLGGEWDGSSPAATGIYTLALGISLAEKISMFVESYGFLPQGDSPDHRFDAGFTFLIAKNVQADVSGGMGISEKSPDFFIGAGLSFRLPR